jgi:hypothetical protein
MSSTLNKKKNMKKKVVQIFFLLSWGRRPIFLPSMLVLFYFFIFLFALSVKGEFREWGEERGRRGEGFVFLYFTLTDTIHRMSE